MDDVSLAAELVREAGQLAASMLGEGLETEYKSSVSDVVSAADHAAEELVTPRLAEHPAAHRLVGDALSGLTWQVAGNRRSAAEATAALQT